MGVFLIFLGLFSLSQSQFFGGQLNPAGQLANTAAQLPGANLAKQTADAVLDAAFGDFKKEFQKTYPSLQDELRAKTNYIANRAKVLATGGVVGTFTQKLNEFADMVSSEFNAAFNGFGKSTHPPEKPLSKGTEYKPPAQAPAVPTEFDWRKKGGVTPIKSQQQCAGCWAFAASGALEGHYFRKTGKLVEVSPQHLLDCSGKYGNSGCKGGLTNPAFDYIKDNKGVSSFNSYPFEAKDGQCRYNKEHSVAEGNGFAYIDEGSEKHLEQVVSTLGPVAVAIDAGHESFQFYNDGVYFEKDCGKKVSQLNHAVLVVGYGVEPNGDKYWLVKNSYGPKWGIGGYIKMAKDKDNHCGIASYASYPLV